HFPYTTLFRSAASLEDRISIIFRRCFQLLRLREGNSHFGLNGIGEDLPSDGNIAGKERDSIATDVDARIPRPDIHERHRLLHEIRMARLKNILKGIVVNVDDSCLKPGKDKRFDKAIDNFGF